MLLLLYIRQLGLPSRRSRRLLLHCSLCRCWCLPRKHSCSRCHADCTARRQDQRASWNNIILLESIACDIHLRVIELLLFLPLSGNGANLSLYVPLALEVCELMLALLVVLATLDAVVVRSIALPPVYAAPGLLLPPVLLLTLLALLALRER